MACRNTDSLVDEPTGCPQIFIAFGGKGDQAYKALACFHQLCRYRDACRQHMLHWMSADIPCLGINKGALDVNACQHLSNSGID